MSNFVAGRRADRTANIRNYVISDMEVLPGGKIVDSSLSADVFNSSNVREMQAGLPMGIVTASGKVAPSIIGQLAQAHTSDSANTIVVTPATAVELQRRILDNGGGTFKLTGPPTTAGTVATATVTFTAVNTTSGAVTHEAVSTNFVDGSWIQPNDGSETVKFLIPPGDDLRVIDEDGLDTTDVRMDRPVIGAYVRTANLPIYDGTDASLKAELKTQLRATGGTWTFDDDFGG